MSEKTDDLIRNARKTIYDSLMGFAVEQQNIADGTTQATPAQRRNAASLLKRLGFVKTETAEWVFMGKPRKKRRTKKA